MHPPPLHHDTIANKSAVAPRPKDAFIEWIGLVAATHPLNWSAEHILQAREPIVWIIPSLGSFSSGEALDSFLESHKAPMLHSELRGLHLDERLWPALTAESFDTFFELHIYDHVASIRHLDQETEHGEGGKAWSVTS